MLHLTKSFFQQTLKNIDTVYITFIQAIHIKVLAVIYLRKK